MSPPKKEQVRTDTTVVSNPSDITGKLSTWISSTTIDSIPADVVTRAKYLILDGIACGLVASHLP